MSLKSPHDKYKESFQAGLDDLSDFEKKQNDVDAELFQPEQCVEFSQEQDCDVCPIKIKMEEDKLRIMAEMENYKKRLSREHGEQLKYATEAVLASLLPTLDNLDLALQYGSQSEAGKDILIGVEMTRKLLLDAVKSHGLEPIGEVGEDYTPELHEALSFEVRDDMEDGKVSNMLQRGYKLKDRVIRPAKICISKMP